MKRIYNMSPKDTLFFAEMYTLVKKMEDTIVEFDMKDRTIASIVVGVIDYEGVDLDNDLAEMRTMYSFNLESREELDAVKQIMDVAYKSDDDDPLEGLLGDLGISLN